MKITNLHRVAAPLALLLLGGCGGRSVLPESYAPPAPVPVADTRAEPGAIFNAEPTFGCSRTCARTASATF